MKPLVELHVSYAFLSSGRGWLQRHKSVFATSTTNAEALQLPDFKDGDGMLHVRIATTMA